MHPSYSATCHLGESTSEIGKLMRLRQKAAIDCFWFHRTDFDLFTSKSSASITGEYPVLGLGRNSPLA